MKKCSVLLFCIATVLMTACTKSTTYEVYNGTSGYSMYDVKAYEYSGSNAVGYYDVGFLSANASSGAIEATKDAKQVNIAFKFVPNGDVYTTADYFTLTKGGHTMILIEDHTHVIGGSSKDEMTIASMIK